MNIIFGVIIDTFAELRAKKEQIYLDMSGTKKFKISLSAYKKINQLAKSQIKHHKLTICF